MILGDKETGDKEIRQMHLPTTLLSLVLYLTTSTPLLPYSIFNFQLLKMACVSLDLQDLQDFCRAAARRQVEGRTSKRGLFSHFCSPKEPYFDAICPSPRVSNAGEDFFLQQRNLLFICFLGETRFALSDN